MRYIFLPSSTFIANVKGYPVLPKPTQQFIRDSMIASAFLSCLVARGARTILTCCPGFFSLCAAGISTDPPLSLPASAMGTIRGVGRQRTRNMCGIWRRRAPQCRPRSSLGQSRILRRAIRIICKRHCRCVYCTKYFLFARDSVVNLQPLMDNLPSVTYQTFEQDPVKYAQYEEAMYRAFLDHPAGERM